jgi:hypothetical protein
MKGLLKTTVKIDLTELEKADVTLGSQLPDLKVADLLNGPQKRVIIFDDIERSSMKPSEILAYINPLVEHDDCKVIVVSDEERLQFGEGSEVLYKLWREKTIGQTLEVEADLESAFDDFLTVIRTASVREFYRSHKNKIFDVFFDSETGNLRLLKRFLWDFEQFCENLTDEQRQHEIGMVELLCLLCALTLEIRSGNILSSNVNLDQLGASLTLLANANDERAVAQKELFQKYEKSVNFSSRLLLPATVVKVIDLSVYPKAEIQAQLTAHPYFARPEEVPSWKMLWLSGEVDTVDIPAALTRFEADFSARRFTLEPEILHVIGICLWLARIQQPGWSSHNVATRLQCYIDDVFKQREATLLDLVPKFELGPSFGGAFGLGFRESETAGFQTLHSYLRTVVAAWREAAYPKAAESILAILRGDSNTFLRTVCNTAEGQGQFSRVPILRMITPDDFVAAVVDMPWADRKNVYVALSIRYEFLAGNRGLLPEKGWLQSVYSGLLAHAETLDPIPRDHWRAQITAFLEKVVSQTAEAS